MGAIKDRVSSLFSRSSQPSEETLALREDFEREGYVTIEGLVDPSLCDRVVEEAEAFYATQDCPPEAAERTMNMHQVSPTAKSILHGESITDVVSGLLEAKAVFLQSIYFNSGSQQSAHSDYMFMSTEPPLQLCGVWIACEDVAEGAGPLLYFPGSHKLDPKDIPTAFAESVDDVQREIDERGPELEREYADRLSTGVQSLLSLRFYDRWTEQLHASLADSGLRQRTYLASKGDVLVWHANLAHGGSPVTEEGSTRKSLVAHYLTRRVRKYIDMQYPDSRHTYTLRTINHDRPPQLFRKS